jgi:STE24 endopeptidase
MLKFLMIAIHTVTIVLAAAAALPELLSALANLLDRRRLPDTGDFSYQRTASGFSAFRRTVSLLLLFLFWFTGGFALVAGLAVDLSARVGGRSASAGIILAVSLFLLAELAAIPFGLYATFSIEERFGFNRSTLKTFLGDMLKGTLITMIIGIPLFLLIFVFYRSYGKSGWFPAWAAYSLISLLITFIAPSLILPLFNRFTPMDEGTPLKEKLEKLAEKAGIRIGAIEVIDGSKRSSKANAFVAGFGKGRRVALYDTFLQDRPDEEVEAVVAHEFGHIVKGHVVKQIIGTTLFSLPVFFLLFRAAASPLLFQAFGIRGMSPADNQGIALVLLAIAAGFIASLFSPLILYFSRKREWQADHFARDIMGTGSSLASALSGLEKKNGSHPDPHRLSVMLHYSHPPVSARTARLTRNHAG